MHVRALFIVVFFIVLELFSAPELQAYEIQHLGIKNGLSSGYVNDFAKDSLGYMWIATNNGLNRYSGYEIRKYKVGTQTDRGDSRIINLIKHNGDLFAIARNGIIYKYRYYYNDFIELNKAFGRNFVASCLVDSDHIALGLTNGLVLYNFAKNTFSKILYSNFTYNRHLSVRGSKVYVATSKGVKIFQFSNDNLILLKTLLEGRDIIHFEFDKYDRLWVGTEKDGLYVIDGNKVTPIPLFEPKIKTYAVRCIAFSKSNEAIVAVDRLGLFVIDEKFKVRQRFKHEPDDANSIRQNSIHDIYVDESNIYWLASGETGVDILINNNRPFTNIFHILNQQNSLHNNTVRSIFQDTDGYVWFGTEDGLSRMSPKGEWKKFNRTVDLEETPVLSITSYRNQMLLGTYGEGVLKFNPKTGKTSRFAVKGGSNIHLVFCTYVHGGELWVGGNDGPITRYKNNRVSHTHLVGGGVKCFVGDKNGNVFVGGVNGVFELNKRNGRNHQLVFSDQMDGNLLTNVYSLYYHHNKLWIGNDKGLFCYNLTNKETTRVNQLEDNDLGTVYSIQGDSENRLWMGTSTGLWGFYLNKGFFRKYDERDGVFANEFGFGASAKFRDGQLAFGGPVGAVLFYPDSVKEVIPSGDIRVSEFLINGVRASRILTNGNINYLHHIVLEYNQNSLSFTFELIELHGARKSKFEWQLVGYDEQPFISSNNRTAHYSKLPSGHYQLVVKAISPNGNYFGSPYQLAITIQQPWWLRWWALTAYAFLLFGLIYLLYESNRAKVLQRFSDEKVKFFVDVAHDIRTPVSLIQLLVGQLKKTEGNKESIELIKRNSTNLNEYVTQLLEFQKAERKKLKLAVRKVRIKTLLKTIAADFQPLLEKKSMDIHVSCPEIDVWMDKQKMSRVFSNLISNAIKYGEEGGYIKIKAERVDDKIHFNFIDNGLGIPQKQQKEIFSRFLRADNARERGISGSGIGLMLAKHIVELHKGEVFFESRENIGSTFTIVLKLGSEHFDADELLIENVAGDNGKKVSDLIGENALVLLVEDNDDLRMILKQELDKYYRVIEASNGKEGLVLAIEKVPDIIVTDVMMPQMSGKELCRVIKSNFKTSHIPVIMITALSDLENKVEGLEIGADAYVEKPFNMELLRATINNLLRTRKALGNLSEQKATSEEPHLSPDEKFLSKTVQIIKEKRMDENFTVDLLCELLGMSRSNLFRKLKGLTGMTPSDLITKIKLNHAVELFKSSSKMRIADIAYESGFHDPKYFSTVFKKFYGKTPKEFLENPE